MLGNLIKRLFNGVVLLFAVIAFFRVPLGAKTGAEHVAAILATPPAREAGHAIAEAAQDIAARAIAEVGKVRQEGAHVTPEAPLPETDAR